MKRNRLCFWRGQFIIVSLWGLLLLAGCNIPPIGPIKQLSAVTATPAPSTSGKKPLHIVSIIDKQPLQLCNAPLVADVTVGKVGPAQWNTIDGKKPSLEGLSASAVVHNGYFIYTEVQFSRLHPLFDRRTQPTEFFLTMGGQIGQDQYEMIGYPQLQAGQRYLIIFAPGYDRENAATTQRWLVVDEAYSIDEHGRVVLPNESTSSGPNGEDIPTPAKLLSLADFAKQFANCA